MIIINKLNQRMSEIVEENKININEEQEKYNSEETKQISQEQDLIANVTNIKANEEQEQYNSEEIKQDLMTNEINPKVNEVQAPYTSEDTQQISQEQNLITNETIQKVIEEHEQYMSEEAQQISQEQDLITKENNIKVEEEKNNINRINIEEQNVDKSESNISNFNEIISNNINNINNINKEEKTTEIEEVENALNIDFERNKNDQIINTNTDNIISNPEEDNGENIDNIKINEYLEQEDLKCNKEYIEDDEDLTSRRLTARNDIEKYLLVKDDVSEEEKEDDNSFPFTIIGDAKKKSEKLGNYNNRYLEIDSVKGLFKRYKSSKDYPKKPKEIIDIRNFKLIRKLKQEKDAYDLEITYTITKKSKKVDKIENFRFRHLECRNKWFDSLLFLWKYYIKENQDQKFTNNILLFVDDRIGIVQEFGKKKEKNKIKNSEINLKKFKILSLLGVGGFGTVFKVKHILTDKIYAMKVMNKNYIIQKKYLHYIVSEFEIMKSLAGFPFVLDIHYCFQSANYLYLIIDYCPNGDFTKLKRMNNLKLFFAEVILAFEHIHNHNIVYRDLKPENILLDETGHIRVCDFNLAKSGMTRGKRADSFCGTPLYFSPEMLNGKGVDYKCDIYDIGLLMYELVTGFPAFNAPNLRILYDKIKKNQINFRISGLHGDIKDLIENMVSKDPEKRYTLEEIKKHPYFKDIDFNKVLRKEYGKIETEKIHKKKDNENSKNNEEFEYEQFKLKQQKLDENKEYTFLKGKITVKEMYLDQKRAMKNYVREFYYVKNEDLEQTKDFKLDVKETLDINSLIKDEYQSEL